jgi:hypothetical protein
LLVSLRYSSPPFNAHNSFRKTALSESALSERRVSVRILVNLVSSVRVGYFYSYVIVGGVCKYYDSVKESKHGLISFESILYI